MSPVNVSPSLRMCRKEPDLAVAVDKMKVGFLSFFSLQGVNPLLPEGLFPLVDLRMLWSDLPTKSCASGLPWPLLWLHFISHRSSFMLNKHSMKEGGEK